jgi:hypothetical protein
MNDASRNQGWAICFGAGFLAFLFLVGILSESYWALAIPIAVLVFFVLGLASWVGYTIATIRTDAEPVPPIETQRPAETSPEATSDAAAS